MTRVFCWSALALTLCGVGWGGDTAQLEPLTLFTSERDAGEQGWTLTGEWHFLKEPLKPEGPFRYALTTIGFSNAAAAARVDLGVALARLPASQRERVKGWRLGLELELPGTTTLELKTLTAADGSRLVVRLLETKLELGVERKGQPFEPTLTRTLEQVPSSIWLAWDGKTCALRVDRPDAKPLCELQPGKGRPAPAQTGVEFALSGIGQTEHAILRNPTLLPVLR